MNCNDSLMKAHGWPKVQLNGQEGHAPGIGVHLICDMTKLNWYNNPFPVQFKANVCDVNWTEYTTTHLNYGSG